jgi:hypothetical protein
MQQEIIRSRFLAALIKIRPSWENEKQFTKILSKMEKGKDLKKKEFDKIYCILREQGQRS